LIFPYKPDGRYSVKPDGTLQIDNVQPADAGEFECEALNTVGTLHFTMLIFLVNFRVYTIQKLFILS
jgi:hypothetical protein